MKTVGEVKEQIEYHEQSLNGWREPDGYLCPTEPDSDERESVRRELRSAIQTLKWVLEE